MSADEWPLSNGWASPHAGPLVLCVVVFGAWVHQDIDVQGVQKIKTTEVASHFLFIAPPSFEALESRLRARCVSSNHPPSDFKAPKSARWPGFGLFCKPDFLCARATEMHASGWLCRATESEKDLETRLGNARAEVEFGMGVGNFEKVVVNDVLEEAYQDLKAQLVSWYPQLAR
jgi:guanylate kinase